MKQLIQDYKRRLDTINQMIANFKSNGSVNDIRKDERLKTKAGEYMTFIVEMERVLSTQSTQEVDGSLGNSMKDLISQLLTTGIIRSPELDFSIHPVVRVTMFTVETDELFCKVWNSSNDARFDRDYVCKEIASQLLDDDTLMEGSVSYNLNEIMFEITEK
jgi:hypothetical protein